MTQNAIGQQDTWEHLEEWKDLAENRKGKTENMGEISSVDSHKTKKKCWKKKHCETKNETDL
jgi:hypothetical protein